MSVLYGKQKTAYEVLRSLVGSEMCIRDRYMTYAYDAFTFGIQDNDSDSEVANADEEYRAYALSLIHI